MLTHCPHCGKKLLDERLDAKGYPIQDSEWELEAPGGPATKLRVTDVEPGNRLGREIRGVLAYRTKEKGTVYADDAVATYSTDLETFHKTWAYTGNKDNDAALAMQLKVGDGG